MSFFTFNLVVNNILTLYSHSYLTVCINSYPNTQRDAPDSVIFFVSLPLYLPFFLSLSPFSLFPSISYFNLFHSFPLSQFCFFSFAVTRCAMFRSAYHLSCSLKITTSRLTLCYASATPDCQELKQADLCLVFKKTSICLVYT